MRRRSWIVGLSLLSLGLAGLPGGPGEARAQTDDKKTADKKTEEKKEAAAPKQGEDRVIPAPAESVEKAESSRQRLLSARIAAEERAARQRREAELAGAYYPYPPPYPSPYYYYPWYGLPQTYRTKRYPPPITHVPRLGLQHTYLDAYQMGIRIPDDSDPLDVAPNLGEFRGVVGEAKAEQAAIDEESAAAAGGPVESIDQDPVVTLMKAGKYREAGRILADRLGESDDPGTALLLTEVFFALGKPAHAELLLRNALESRRVLEALPADVSSHFPSKDDFESKVQDLGSGGETKLLAGYFLLHSKSSGSGIDSLGKLAAAGDKAAARLYRHYLSRAFKE